MKFDDLPTDAQERVFTASRGPRPPRGWLVVPTGSSEWGSRGFLIAGVAMLVGVATLILGTDPSQHGLLLFVTCPIIGTAIGLIVVAGLRIRRFRRSRLHPCLIVTKATAVAVGFDGDPIEACALREMTEARGERKLSGLYSVQYYLTLEFRGGGRISVRIPFSHAGKVARFIEHIELRARRAASIGGSGIDWS